MRTLILFLLLGSMKCLVGQPASLQFFESNQKALTDPRSNPKLIGKIGDNILMMNLIPKGTNLIVYDSSFQIIKETEQLLSFYQAHKQIKDDSLRVAWSEFHTDEEWLCLQSFDKSANPSAVRKVVLENTGHRFVNLVTDKLNQFYFFYTVTQRDSPNVLLKGLILDTQWNTLKEVSGIFQFSSSLERAPLPIIDVDGNIQVIVYDKLSNFKLSAGLTVHTLLYKEDFFRKESFELDKIKLYNPSIYEDIDKKQLTLVDFYYDGQTKEKNGIVTIKIPYQRGTGLMPIFQEIPDSIKISLRANTKNTRSKQPILESILKTDTYEYKGSKLIMSDLLDLPIHQLVRDAEVEPEFRINNRSRFRYDRPGGTSNANNGLGSSSLQDPNKPQGRTSNVGSTGTRVPATINRASGSTAGSNGTSPISLLPPPASNVNYKMYVPPSAKRALFLLNEQGEIKWYKYLPETFVNYRFFMYTPWNYMIRTEKEWQFLHYDESEILPFSMFAKNWTETPDYNSIRFTLIWISENGIRTQAIQSICAEGTRFLNPLQLKENVFVMPFINYNLGSSGLAVLNMGKNKEE